MSDVLLPSGDDGRDTAGRFVRGNQAATITGARSIAFWREAEAAKYELAAAVCRDLGHAGLEDAPVTVRQTALGLAQAAIVRDSAWQRLIENGGPLTGKDRERGAHRIWAGNADRVLRHTSTLGLERKLPPALSPTEYWKSKQRGEGAPDAS